MLSFSHSKSMNLLIILLLSALALLIACGPAQPDTTVDTSPAATATPVAAAEIDWQTVDDDADVVEEEAPEPIVEADDADDEAMVEDEQSDDELAEAVEEDSAESPAETEPEPTDDKEPLIRAKAGTEMINEDGISMGFTEDGHAYIGDVNAPVVINEYSDYQCPFCGRFYSQTLGSLKSAEIANGDAVLVFYDFPLNFHAQAAAAANAARCAGDQGVIAYWDMHDKLFDTLGQWSVADPSPMFVNYAAEIGIDTGPFADCVSADTYADAVQADLESGQQLGVRGTPAFFINGELVSGAQPYNVFVGAISRAKAGEQVVAEPEPVDVGEIEPPTPFDFSDNVAGALGDPDAPVRIIEFTDYECPFCARHSSETLPVLMQQYIDEGRVYYMMKDLPLDQIHPKARDAANAARCAGDQGSYWEMHDVLFEQKDSWAAVQDSDSVFVEIAASLGLDTSPFETCVAERTHADAVNENVLEAQQIGIGGTPFFVVDGFPVINGAQPIDVFEQVIGLAEEGELVNAIMDAQRRQLEQQAQQQQQQQAPPAPTGPVDVPERDAFVLGSPDAPVTIVEYTDLQCPFCLRHFNNTYPRILQDYINEGLVRYVFKDFPLDNIHPQANMAAQAVRCAGEQDEYIGMHDIIFRQQSEWSGQQNAGAIFAGYATDIGIDATTFTSCLDSNKYNDAVNADLQEGANLGVRGTPAFFVNGTFVNGAQPYNVFQGIIDSALAETADS